MHWLLFGITFAVQVGYGLLLQAGFRRARHRLPRPSSPPPVSVVVAARNEAARLPALLAALAQQTHPCHELIVVDDASTDGTAPVVQTWAETHPNVRLLSIPTGAAPAALPRKQRALARGIQAASHELLALTDADCVPPRDWLARLARYHAAHPGALLVGYGPYHRQPGLLNRLARYETFVTGYLTAAAAGLGRPYMAVGRNLSYSRTLFDRIGGFARAGRSMSGDDDLFVQEVVRQGAGPVLPLLDAATFVPSAAPQTWAGWLHQKQRHTATGRYYARGIQAHLALFHATGLLLWLAPLFLGRGGTGLLAARLFLQRCLLRKPAAVFDERDLLPAQPVLELLYAAYNLVVAPLGLLRQPRQWRQV